MKLELLLTECIEAIEQGATLAECLAAHPAEALALEPLLRLALQLQQLPPARLSDRAFARGRAALATQARVQQMQRQSSQTVHRQPPSQAPQRAQRQDAGLPQRTLPRISAPKRAPQWSVLFMGTAIRLAFVFTLLLGMLTFLRVSINSLPGAALYPIKTSFEKMEGLLLAAAGESAVWHRRQVERRLAELEQLAQLQAMPDAAYLQTVEDEVQNALEATAKLEFEARHRFLASWLAELTALQATAALPPVAVPTLGQIVADVQAAMTQVEQPTVIATATATLTMTPTTAQQVEAISTPTPLLQPTSTPIVEPTIMAITVTATSNSITLPPTATNSALPLAPPAPTATATPLPIRTLAMPKETKSSSNDDSDNESSGAGTIPQPANDTIVETPTAVMPAIGEAAAITDTQNSGGSSNQSDPEVTATPEIINVGITPEGTETPSATSAPETSTATPQPETPNATVAPTQIGRTATSPATSAATGTTATEQSVPTQTVIGKATATPVAADTPRPDSEGEAEEDNNSGESNAGKATESPTEPPPTVGPTATNSAKPTHTPPPTAPPAPTPKPEASRTPQPEKTATPANTTAPTNTPKVTPAKSTEGATKTPSS